MAETYDAEGKLVTEGGRRVVVVPQQRRDMVNVLIPHAGVDYDIVRQEDGRPVYDSGVVAPYEGAGVSPYAVAFDPTKPTIDQTRSAAIDSIRNNFAALSTAAAIDPTTFLPKTGGVATDLRITNPGTGTDLTLRANAANQWTSLSFQNNAATLRYQFLYDGGNLLYWRAFSSGGTERYIWQVNPESGVLYSNFVQLGFGAPPRANWDIDAHGAGQQVFAFGTDGAATLLAVTSGNTVQLRASSRDGSSGAVLAAQCYLDLMTVNNAGAENTRLRIDPTGPIKSMDGQAAFVGSYTWAGSGACDFTKNQTIGISAGATVSSITMAAGQIARILAWGAGAIVLPSGVKLPQGGAIWGNAFTIVSLFTWDGTTIAASFTPYD